MTELQTMSPVMQRLFEDIDDAAAPQSAALREVAAAWNSARHRSAAAVMDLLPRPSHAHAFVVGRSPVHHLPRLMAPPHVPAGLPLAELANPRLVARLRRVLAHVAARNEPLVVRHRLRLMNNDKAYAELFAAPCRGKTGEERFLCALALRQLQGSWDS
jgi:hypothetical protein